MRRVVAMPEPLRQAMQQARDAQGQTNAAFVAGAVADHLPRLMAGLQALGHDKLRGKRRPVRLPFSKEAITLQALREASDQVQVPAIQLLLLCGGGDIGAVREAQAAGPAEGIANRCEIIYGRISSHLAANNPDSRRAAAAGCPGCLPMTDTVDLTPRHPHWTDRGCWHCRRRRYRVAHPTVSPADGSCHQGMVELNGKRQPREGEARAADRRQLPQQLSRLSALDRCEDHASVSRFLSHRQNANGVVTPDAWRAA